MPGRILISGVTCMGQRLDGHGSAEENRRPYAALDILRLFFALCVTAIHTYALEGLSAAANFWITQAIFRMAVPFFFITSGFLLGKKLQGGAPERMLAGYIRKLLPPLLCVGIANGVLEWILWYLRGGTGFRSRAIAFVKHFLFYPYGAMWFVQACIVGAAMLYPFLKRRKLALALMAGAVLHVWALLCNNYYFLSQAAGLDGYVDAYMSVFISGRNGVFVGFFYLALGMETWHLHQKRFKMRTLAAGLAVCSAAYLVEIWLLAGRAYLDDRALYLAQIALAPALVLCVARMELPGSCVAAGLRCRSLSAWIYFSHRLIYVLGRIAFYSLSGTDLRGAGAFVSVTALGVLLFALWRSMIRFPNKKNAFISLPKGRGDKEN